VPDGEDQRERKNIDQRRPRQRDVKDVAKEGGGQNAKRDRHSRLLPAECGDGRRCQPQRAQHKLLILVNGVPDRHACRVEPVRRRELPCRRDEDDP
jgi:hypothetical protein